MAIGVGVLPGCRRRRAGDRGLIAAPGTPLASLLFRPGRHRCWYRLVELFHCPVPVRKSYPPRIFSEAHHGTEASRALTLGTRTKPPIRPSFEPAPLRCLVGSEGIRGALGT